MTKAEQQMSSNQSPAEAHGNVLVPLYVLEDAAEAIGHFLSDYGWSDSDMQAMDNLDAYIARHKANVAANVQPKGTVAEKLPEPFGYFCEWAQRGTYPPTQTMYYGHPGNGVDDDWNCHPEVHKNVPLFTADQMRDYARATLNTQAPAPARQGDLKC